MEENRKITENKFDSKPVYGDAEKYIKTNKQTNKQTNKKTVIVVLLQIFIIKKFQKKKHDACVYQ